MAIYRIFQQRAFEREAVVCMAKAYEDALVALKLSDREDPFTEIVAKKIVEIAGTGERDPDRLRDEPRKQSAIKPLRPRIRVPAPVRTHRQNLNSISRAVRADRSWRSRFKH